MQPVLHRPWHGVPLRRQSGSLALASQVWLIPFRAASSALRRRPLLLVRSESLDLRKWAHLGFRLRLRWKAVRALQGMALGEDSGVSLVRHRAASRGTHFTRACINPPLPASSDTKGRLSGPSTNKAGTTVSAFSVFRAWSRSGRTDALVLNQA